MQTITNEKERKWARASVEAGVTSKLGLDVHAGQITVCRQDGGLVPPRWDAAGKRVKGRPGAVRPAGPVRAGQPEGLQRGARSDPGAGAAVGVVPTGVAGVAAGPGANLADPGGGGGRAGHPLEPAGGGAKGVTPDWVRVSTLRARSTARAGSPSTAIPPRAPPVGGGLLAAPAGATGREARSAAALSARGLGWRGRHASVPALGAPAPA